MTPDSLPAPNHGIAFRDAVRVWIRIAALSFGGPAGQIAVMHRILVEEKRWIEEEHFLHALNYCMLLPGPEAQQLATYIGWLLHKTKGGFVAGTLFILPGFVAIMALSWIYAIFGNAPPVAALFFGLKAAVLAIVLDAVRRIGGRALRTGLLRLIAAVAFIALFFFAVPFPFILLAAALIGYGAQRAGLFGEGGAAPARHNLIGDHIPAQARPHIRSSLRLSILLLFLWLAPVAALHIALGPSNIYTEIATFFSRMAVATFGGAYAILAYVAQQAVSAYGWLAPGEMLDGLGMAETTPGPLIMVTQFVGFMGAYRQADGLNPLLAGTLGGILTMWVTFVPCFLWIFLGAPYAERLRESRALSAALRAIGAAVAGTILNLALWFALHSLFRTVRPVGAAPFHFDVPVLASLDLPAFLLAAAAVIAVLRFRVPPQWVLAGCALAGFAYKAPAFL